MSQLPEGSAILPLKSTDPPLRQLMGMCYTPAWLRDPDLAIPALKTTREGGFGTIIGFVRHMHHTVTSDYVRQAVARTVENCHQIGLRFVLDMDWAHWAGEHVELHPEIAQWRTVRGEAPCLNGRYELNLAYPSVTMPQVAEISAAYGVTAGGETVLLDVASLDCERRSYNSQYPIISYDDDHLYVPHRPAFGAHYTLGLTGRIDRRFVKLILYVAFQGMDYPDVAHPTYLRIQRELLDSYAKTGLDGVGWDEPGKGGRFDGWKTGAGFHQLFEKRHGYDLRPRLIELDEGASTQTRRDYHDTLREMNYQAQKQFNDHARALFGDDIFRGMHNTFSGISVDIRCGCIDYFRLGQNLSYAFTDTGWDQGTYAETHFQFALAEGLRKELNRSRAYCNDWSRTPRVKWYDYFTRIKSLYLVEWFAIFIGEYNERHSLFPNDPYWQDVARNATALNQLASFLGDAYDTVSDTAVWFGWESLAVLPAERNYLIPLMQTAQCNLAEAALHGNCFYDLVSDGAVEKARVDGDRLIINNRRYKRLVMPFAVCVRPEIWELIEAAATASIPVIFYGPPPADETLNERFAHLVGMEPVPFADYDRWFRSTKPTPRIDQWEPCSVDFSYPAIAHEATQVIRTTEGEIISLQNPATQTAWLVSVDPAHDARPLLGPAPLDGLDFQHQGTAHRRILRGKQGDRHVLLFAARLEEQLDEVITIGSHTITLRQGAWAAIHLNNSQTGDVLILG